MDESNRIADMASRLPPGVEVKPTSMSMEDWKAHCIARGLRVVEVINPKSNRDRMADKKTRHGRDRAANARKARKKSRPT